MCVVYEGIHDGFLAQGNLCGGAMLVCLFLRTTLSAPHACNYSLLWKCTASGSCRRIALISDLSCFGSTRRWSWSRMNLGARSCSWLEMMVLVLGVCHCPFHCPCDPTLLMSLDKDLQQLPWQFGISASRCTHLYIYLPCLGFPKIMLNSKQIQGTWFSPIDVHAPIGDTVDNDIQVGTLLSMTPMCISCNVCIWPHMHYHFY